MICVIRSICYRICKFFIVKYRRRLYKHYGDNVVINKPLKITGKNFVSIESGVRIDDFCWIVANPIAGDKCQLDIGENSRLGHFNHIYATKSIRIGRNVLLADKVYIADNSHTYENIDCPIKVQPIKQLNSVMIGDESWIGENVCIIGASVGKHSIIGANSVVLSDIPDYSVAVGAPARIVKKYDFIQSKWVKF